LQEKIPKTDGLTALGLYVLVAIFFVWGALVEFAFLLIKKRRHMMIQCQNEILMSKPQLSSSKAWEQQREEKRILELKSISADCLTDQIAFVLFNVLLILFNVVYWCYYII
jgi:hypothetical protein